MTRSSHRLRSIHSENGGIIGYIQSKEDEHVSALDNDQSWLADFRSARQAERYLRDRCYRLTGRN